MKTRLAFIAIAGLLFLHSCGEEKEPTPDGVKIQASIPEKYAITPSIINIFSDADNKTKSVLFDSEITISNLSSNAKTIYALLPVATQPDGPTSVPCKVSPVLNVDAEGKLGKSDCYLYAKSSIVDNKATLVFKPVAASINFKVSKNNSDLESIVSLSFTPDDLTGLTGIQTIDLTASNVRFTQGNVSTSNISLNYKTPVSVAGAVVENRIYLPYASYNNVSVVVLTTKGQYTFNVGSVDMSNVSEKDINLALQDAIDFVPIGDILNEDIIPDFGGVGYQSGMKDIPEIPVVMTLNPPSDGKDATDMIQDAINTAVSPGAILLKAGRYNIGSKILLNRDGIVLRGEGQGETGTVLYSTFIDTEGKKISLVEVGKTGGSVALDNNMTNISEQFVPCGRMSFLVSSTAGYAVGDRIAIYRPGTQVWINALLMNQIPDDGDTKQWQPEDYNMNWERVITKIDGNRVYIDNPVVMALDKLYGGGFITHVTSNRISECGIENLRIDSYFDITGGGDQASGEYFDEKHCWNGVAVGFAENVWIKDVTTIHMGCSAVRLNDGSKNVTIKDCTSLAPVSQITGSRRYAFNFDQPQLSLCIGCKCERDRHQFVTGSRVCGPNAFVECTASDSYADAGPHHRWANGILWDCVESDSNILIRDRGNLGSGHGWAGANCVLWNCSSLVSMQCDNPQVSAKNYAVGCVSPDRVLGRSANGKDRPVGEWASYNTPVLSGTYFGASATQKSLYRSQLAARKAK